MLLRPAAVVFFSTLGVLSAAEAAKPREESMRSDRFAEAHAPLFQPPKSNQAGALTQKIAASLPRSGAAAVSVPVNNFIDKFIFAKIAKDGIPHAPLSTDYEFLRRVSLPGCA